MDTLVSTIKDQNLKFTLSFGVGIHHAGLHEQDRRTVEQLFVNQKIQVGSNYGHTCSCPQILMVLGYKSI